MSNRRIYRCAIYTRKSTADGLEQDFNSLDAQREACEAYVMSQKSQGWKLLIEPYDDGGISGGHIDRPGLKGLIKAIKAKQIDVVVVYKVDRLTRSLADFARLVDVFDAHGVSFVSVTQQFNTTSSMGRLTLNVLLSFAQFEREVTAERIRDKIAASKKKGKWMGGVPPLGLDNIDKKLVINEAEAKTVRQLFDLYLQLGSVADVKTRADKHGLVTKRRTRGNNRMRGGIPFSRGHLYQLLSNPVYAGNVKHGKRVYPGEHEAIIEPDIWQSVQALLKTNAGRRQSDKNRKSTHILTGLVYDETGDLLSPVHTNKAGQIYRYYVSHRLVINKGKDASGWRLPTQRFEQEIVSTLAAFLANPKQLLKTLQIKGQSPDEVDRLLKKAKQLSSKLDTGNSNHQRKVITELISRVDLARDRISFQFNNLKLMKKLGIETICHSASTIGPLECPARIRRRGVESSLIIGAESQSNNLDTKLIKTIARSYYWFEQLKTGKLNSITEIANASNMAPGDVSRLLPLAFISPGIIKMILNGQQPLNLTTDQLVRFAPKLSLSWTSQQDQLITSSQY